MPDLEQRIKDTLDRLGDRPDPARIMDRVGRRKRHFRLMHRAQAVALVLAVLAGVAGGTYALTRAFGVGVGRPAFHPTPSLVPSITPSPVTPTPSASGSVPAIAVCSDQTARVAVASQDGAAGTIRTVWQVTNTAQTECSSFGYPGMDFHTSSGWLNVQVHRGGFSDINHQPTSIVVAPGQSLYFASYWSDVTGNQGSCQPFDRVKVTLPDNQTSAEVASSGCLNPLSVDVGPITRTPPS